MNDFEINKDLLSYREYENGGFKYLLERKDPHGFWYIKSLKGKLHSSLSGAFTSFDRAIESINNHVSLINASRNS